MTVTPGREAAIAWLKRSFQMGVISSLPCDEDGKVIWDLAGPMMQRELPAMKFAVIYLTGLDEQGAEELAMRVLNEWHGLEPNTGLEDISEVDLKPGDLKPGPGADEELQALLSNMRGLVARIKARIALADWDDEEIRAEIEGWEDLVGRASARGGSQLRDRAVQAGADECWVTADGYTKIPELMIEALGIHGGDHVWFLQHGDHWQAWSEDELTRALGGDDPPSEDGARAQRMFAPLWPQVWSAIDRRNLRLSIGGEIDRRLRNAWFMARVRGLYYAWWALTNPADVSDRTRASYERPATGPTSTVRIERVDPVQSASKRFYMPFDIHTTCPKCGRDVTRDSSQHVGSPTSGAVMSVRFYCGFEPEDIEPEDPRWDELSCNHEWSVDMVMDITLRTVTK